MPNQNESPAQVFGSSSKQLSFYCRHQLGYIYQICCSSMILALKGAGAVVAGSTIFYLRTEQTGKLVDNRQKSRRTR
jgi:hypothetical protein